MKDCHDNRQCLSKTGALSWSPYTFALLEHHTATSEVIFSVSESSAGDKR